jgi:hypothetical protein
MVVAVPATTAQTFRLFIAELESSDPTRLIDSTAGPVAGPAFHPELPIVYYSKGNEIIAYNVETEQRNILFAAKTSVHGLRITPDGRTLTYMEKVPARELKRISVNGGGAQTSSVIAFPVENYIWMDDNNLLAVEPGSPNALHLFTLRPSRQVVIARHIGNTLTRYPKTLSFAFVHKLSVDSWSIKTIGPDGSISILTESLPESELFAISASGMPVSYYEGQLHRFNKRTQSWEQIEVAIPGVVTDLQASPLQDKFVLWVKSNKK